MTSLRRPTAVNAIWIALACGLSIVATGCADPIPDSQFARRDFKDFNRQVYPVLLRDCGFPECHGAPERFFRVWGPGRVRLEKLEMVNGVEVRVLPEPFDVPTAAEQLGTMNFALSMIEQRNTAESLLLRKPLSVEAGGAGHRGVDAYGRDVYRTTQDSGYVTLARWVLSEQFVPPVTTP